MRFASILTHKITGLTVMLVLAFCFCCGMAHADNIWGTTPPGTVDSADASAITVGVRFQSSAGGNITGVRFYKASTNTGTHIGVLYNNSGTALATATFSGETSSGWQQVSFSSAVAISANTTYIAAVYMPVGHYSDNSSYFATSGFTNGFLSALIDGSTAHNGIYTYGTGATPPTSSYNSTNYWVDVVFSNTSAPAAPTGLVATPGNGQVSLSWTTPLGTTSYNVYQGITSGGESTTAIATGLTSPSYTNTGLTNGTAYYYKVKAVNSFGTSGYSNEANAQPALPPSTIWGSTIPSSTDAGDTSSITVGVKFQANAIGSITGIRFYKAASNTGTHIGSLWQYDGTLLASAAFTGESASGWQQVSFPTPVMISPNTTYVAGYYAPAGHYAGDGGYFSTAGYLNTDGNLAALLSGGPATSNSGLDGVYSYGTGSIFPTNTFNASNYYADVMYFSGASASPLAPTGVVSSPGATQAYLAWLPTNGAATYNIYRGTVSGGESTTAISTGITVPNYTDSSLSNGTTYFYKIKAVNSYGSSGYSAEVSTTPSAPTFPSSSSTGYTHAPGYPGSLTTFSGTLQSNTTYNYYSFPSGITIGDANTHLNNITFNGCCFQSNSLNDADVADYGSNITFNYCTFMPSAVSSPPVSHTQGYAYSIDQRYDGRLTVDHCDLWGYAEAIQFIYSSQFSPFTVRNSYFHDTRGDGGTDHTDAILENNGGLSYIVIFNNTIVSLGNTNGIGLQGASGYDHATITFNYLSGFGYTVDIGGNMSAVTNTTFTDNTLGTDITSLYGPVYGWNSTGSNLWRRNTLSVPGSTGTIGSLSGSPLSVTHSQSGLFWYPNTTFNTTDYAL